jgi:carbonic anhydrase/acetyltransferase-like protein (isoleucine patch superfamily)
VDGEILKVQIAAILTVAAEESPRRAFSLIGRNTPENNGSFAKVDILGANLLDRTLAKLRDLDTLPPRVLSGRNVSDHVLPSRSTRSGSFIDSWEKAISDYVDAGVQTILLVRVGTYADVDYRELIKFHHETGSPLSHVYCGETSLDIAVVNAALLRNTDDLVRRALSHLIPQQKRFGYQGYVNRLRNREDLHQLMQDGLRGQCQLQPVGVEVQPGVWCGEGAGIDSTVSIQGPIFVGARSKVASGCRIAGISSIERDCEVDCGTMIDNSLVLCGTYVGMALDVRNSIVGNEKIFNLDRSVEVSVSDARLIGRNTKQMASFAGLTSLLRGEAQAAD